jgi:hypothetical protein
VSDIQIDRLSLHVPGLSPAAGRRLALQIAEGLGAAGATMSTRDIPALRIDLTAGPITGVDELARQVIAEILRQVQRQP